MWSGFDLRSSLRPGLRGGVRPGRWGGVRSGLRSGRWAGVRGPGPAQGLRPNLGLCLPGICGIAGPVLFTAAWAISSLRQTGHSPIEVQLSGLAAIDARDPQIMMAGFTGMGACLIVFGRALGRLGVGRTGSWLVTCAGAATIAAGVFRRDHMLLVGPGFAGESWHNQAHDIASGVAYAAMIAAPLVLARAFRSDPRWATISRFLQILTLISAGALVLFASRAVEPWNGFVQRVAVTLPLAAQVLVAARMVGLPEPSAR